MDQSRNAMSHHLCFFLPYSYEFKVKPKNELGEGPPSEPVSFNTESGNVFPSYFLEKKKEKKKKTF